jgi:hypothetical protein
MQPPAIIRHRHRPCSLLGGGTSRAFAHGRARQIPPRRRVSMHRTIVITGIALLALGASAGKASAQCAFEHPKSANKFQSNLVQAFVSCGNVGGNSPNSTTEGGVPSCKPPQTFNEQAGSPPNGWQWDETKGQGSVQLKASKKPLNGDSASGNPNNPAGDTTDVKVTLKLKGVIDALGPVNANGSLSTVTRATFDDRMNGDMTVVDFPASFAFTLTNGKGTLKTSADTVLNAIPQPGLPHCASLESIAIAVLDANTNTFATTGVFLP